VEGDKPAGWWRGPISSGPPRAGLTDVSVGQRCGLESVIEMLLSTIVEGVQLQDFKGLVCLIVSPQKICHGPNSQTP
jgi:hypothetical protein